MTQTSKLKSKCDAKGGVFEKRKYTKPTCKIQETYADSGEAFTCTYIAKPPIFSRRELSWQQPKPKPWQREFQLCKHHLHDGTGFGRSVRYDRWSRGSY